MVGVREGKRVGGKDEGRQRHRERITEGQRKETKRERGKKKSPPPSLMMSPLSLVGSAPRDTSPAV